MWRSNPYVVVVSGSKLLDELEVVIVVVSSAELLDELDVVVVVLVYH